MAKICHDDRGSLLAPLKALGFFTRAPVTEKLAPRPASLNYRGFHVNDWSQCIGCGTCQRICDNAAITMVTIPSLPQDPARGIRNQRPAIDYGRCCWCGLCVDICPSGSIALTREYIHICRESELDSYFVLPDPNGIHGQPFPTGWAKSEVSELIDPARQPMKELPAPTRIQGFDEIVQGYEPQQAIDEAARCVQCGLCHEACPTHMHAPEYIRAIWRGDAEEAVRQIYRTNPFAHVCGRVCTHRCEQACSIGNRGEPLAIRWLKRHAMDSVPDERVRELVTQDSVAAPSGRRVAIVGSGPAGLTAAFDLARHGHAVTVYEALARPGGMPRYGIPAYRLPDDRLDADIAVIEAQGVEIRCNTPIGAELTMETLRQQYDAVVLTIGLQLGRSTRIPGSGHRDVHTAVELLRRIREGEALAPPKRVVIIGGGNVAMDIARSLARLQMRRHGAIDITVCALEDFDHFPADPTELKEAREEGVRVLASRGPKEIVIDADGGLVGLKTLGVTSVFDEQGRFAPRYNHEDEQLHEAAWVVEAIGQISDISILGDSLSERLEWDRGRLRVDENGRTAEPWLWSAGDMVRGPDVVHAVADGHRVAASIHQALQQHTEAGS